MWKEPRRVTSVAAGYICESASELSDPSVITVTKPDDVPVEDPASVLIDWFNRTQELLEESGFHDTPQMPIARDHFANRFGSFICGEVASLEKSQNTPITLHTVDRASSFMSELVLNGANRKVAEVSGKIAQFIASCAVTLAGTETRMLVGMRNDAPAWKNIPRVRSDEVNSHLNIGPLITLGVANDIGRDDTWMVPDPRELSLASLMEHSNITEGDFLNVNAQLIEKAFYNQRYIVDPAGVQVKVTGAGNIEGLYLKVRSAGHNEMVDILARVVTTDGDYFTIINEEKLLHPDSESDTYPSIRSRAAFIICQVYHDLVTSDTIPIMPRGENKADVKPANVEDPSTEFSWTVIPRRIKKVIHEPRQEIPQPTMMEPRRVTGHLRKANMTEGHRDALRQFEQETGVEVLRFIPDGYTFVRPHFSPSIDNAEIATLPRFIRYRIQTALQEALTKKDFASSSFDEVAPERHGDVQKSHDEKPPRRLTTILRRLIKW